MNAGARKRFWEGPGGGREVLAVGVPLMLSQLSYTAQVFVDRIFLTWYSTEAMAGAMAGGITTVALVGLFSCVGEYLTAFVAQYHGAGRKERIGSAVWQGIYFAVGSGLLVAALSPFADRFFGLAGHAAALHASETTFSRILMRGSLFTILMATLASFFAGRGKTRVILVVNVVAMMVNCGLDWLLIFGNAGFPRLGVAGAAIATVTSQAVGCAVFLALFLTRHSRARYETVKGWRFDREFFLRLLRFGMPSGLQFFLEILAFSLFLMIVGRIGTVPLAASALAFNLNMIVFMPMLGLSIAVSSLVGRYLGAGKPDLAQRATFNAFAMSLLFMTACGAVYVLAPRVLLSPYGAAADPAAFAPVRELAVVLLRFVAFYSLFDMMNVIFAGALKGAGDTRYPLNLTAVLSVCALLVPAFLMCVVGNGGVLAAWCAATLYVALLGPLMMRRFLAGRWRTMSLIERNEEAEAVASAG